MGEYLQRFTRADLIGNASIQKAEEELLKVKAKVEEMVVTTDADAEYMSESLSILARLEKYLVEERQSQVKPMKVVVEEIEADFRVILAPIISAKAVAKRKLENFQAWRRQIEEERRAALAKAAEEAAEARRKEAEAAELAAKEAGMPAPDLFEAPAMPIPIEPETPKAIRTMSGATGFRRTWVAEITDLKALARAVADGTVEENCITANMMWLNSEAKRLREEMKIPGVKPVLKENAVVR